jgi:hypothetical protein
VAELLDPAAERLGPGAERLDPAAERLDPGAEQLQSAAERLDPGAERLEPVGGRRQDGGEEPELAEAGGDGMEGRSPSWWRRKAARWRGGAAGEDGREEWPAGMICICLYLGSVGDGKNWMTP